MRSTIQVTFKQDLLAANVVSSALIAASTQYDNFYTMLLRGALLLLLLLIPPPHLFLPSFTVSRPSFLFETNNLELKTSGIIKGNTEWEWHLVGRSTISIWEQPTKRPWGGSKTPGKQRDRKHHWENTNISNTELKTSSMAVPLPEDRSQMSHHWPGRVVVALEDGSWGRRLGGRAEPGGFQSSYWGWSYRDWR